MDIVLPVLPYTLSGKVQKGVNTVLRQRKSKVHSPYYKKKVVRVSYELVKALGKYAEPLEDSFEDAVWKLLRKVCNTHEDSPT